MGHYRTAAGLNHSGWLWRPNTHEKAPGLIGGLQENGVSEEVRTLDIYLGKVVLYQLSYTHIDLENWVESMTNISCQRVFSKI